MVLLYKLRYKVLMDFGFVFQGVVFDFVLNGFIQFLEIVFVQFGFLFFVKKFKYDDYDFFLRSGWMNMWLFIDLKYVERC